MRNRAFSRALDALAHPITITAVAVLLLNDHLLRRLWPSWLTGKLGDAAWLAFAPLVLAALLAWLVPVRLKRPEAIAGGLAFALAGIGFALAKTIPAAHRAATGTLAALTGAPSALRLDPTDLVALPALLLGWLAWQHAGARPAVERKPLAWPVLVLAALATLANSPAPNYGIDCLLVQPDGTLAAMSNWSWHDEIYLSADGGLTWETVPPTAAVNGEACQRDPLDESGAFERADPDDPQVVYRFMPGVGIERTADGGQSWSQELALRGSEAQIAYLSQFRSGAVTVEPGPLDAAILPGSGVVVVAMGHEGVLVRISGGSWQWVAVGGYYHEPISRFGQVWSLLQVEFFLALEAAILAVGTLVLASKARRWWHFLLVVPGWIGWLGASVTSPAINASTYLAPFTVMAAFGAALFALAGCVVGILALAKTAPRALIPAGVTALAAALLFYLPYALWAIGSIPRYATALVFALLLVVVTIVAGGFIVTRSLTTSPSSTPS